MTARANRVIERLVTLLSCVGLLATGAAGELKVIKFRSSYDGKEQKAELFVPSAHDGTKKLPLLAFLPYMGGSMTSARGVGHHETGERLGWLVVCPELHGLNTAGESSFGAVPAQHDVIDAIRFVQEHYQVDEKRIYSDGRSMGGLLSLLVAAKYPHVFAAAMAGQPPTDFSIQGEKPFPEILFKEFGGTRAQRPFEYSRREPITYARNLKYTPVMIWHGTLDQVVPVEHSKRIYALLKKYNPYQYPVYWLEGAGHNSINYGSEWVCEKLRWYQKTKCRFTADLDFVLDESGRFMWMTLEQEEKCKYSSVTSSLREKELTISCSNVRRLTLDMKPFGDRKPTAIRLKCDASLTLEIQGVRGKPVMKKIKGQARVRLP